jgi:rsbT antagonist protein RsbS
VIPILRVAGHLLVSVQTELGDDVVDRFQDAVLNTIEKDGSRTDGLIIDITALEVVDTYVGRVLADTAAMAKLMGRDTVVVGMRPEVAATLVQMGFLLPGIRTALDIDAGIALLDELKR